MKRKMISLQKEAGSKLIEKARTGNDLLEVEKPSRQTLDRLSLFAGFQDWESLKATFMDEGKKEDEKL